jgi:hypothetical protein
MMDPVPSKNPIPRTQNIAMNVVIIDLSIVAGLIDK